MILTLNRMYVYTLVTVLAVFLLIVVYYPYVSVLVSPQHQLF